MTGLHDMLKLSAPLSELWLPCRLQQDFCGLRAKKQLTRGLPFEATVLQRILMRPHMQKVDRCL
jgi:hypothetical protein